MPQIYITIWNLPDYAQGVTLDNLYEAVLNAILGIPELELPGEFAVQVSFPADLLPKRRSGQDGVIVTVKEIWTRKMHIGNIRTKVTQVLGEAISRELPGVTVTVAIELAIWAPWRSSTPPRDPLLDMSVAEFFSEARLDPKRLGVSRNAATRAYNALHTERDTRITSVNLALRGSMGDFLKAFPDRRSLKRIPGVQNAVADVIIRAIKMAGILYKD